MNKTTDPPLLGCVADDFTGASDAASFLAKEGMRTILCNGLPGEGEVPPDCEAVVIALKTRSVPPGEAVEDCLAAFDLLRKLGTGRLYFKYCSTFDSTPTGNIGPVADAMLERHDIRYTLLCPSLPVNGRTVREGRLYVNGQPLDQSPMKDHPLNPMWSAEISQLMAPQSRYPCLVLDQEALGKLEEQGPAALEAAIAEHRHCYLIPDYENDDQGRAIARLFARLPFLTGGSGLLEHLAAENLRSQPVQRPHGGHTGATGKALLLSGSCSVATREQVRHFKEGGGAFIAVDPRDLLAGTQSAASIWDRVASQREPVLVYSVGAEDAASVHTAGGDRERAAALLESTMAQLGGMAREAGFTRIIVAGGETSGAVTQALGFRSFHIGDSVAPGVPVMTPMSRGDMRLVLKSGNFGQPDFFSRALRMTGV